jgi:hypothetical protein
MAAEEVRYAPPNRRMRSGRQVLGAEGEIQRIRLNTGESVGLRQRDIFGHISLNFLLPRVEVVRRNGLYLRRRHRYALGSQIS